MTTRAPKTRTAPVPTNDILEIATSTPDVEAEEAEERRTLFKIDGDEFTVPKVIDERLVFLAMNYMRTEGAWFGAMYLTELLLGGTQYKRLVRLLERRLITQKQFDEISSLVNDLFFNRDQQTADAEEGKASPDSSGDSPTTPGSPTTKTT